MSRPTQTLLDASSEDWDTRFELNASVLLDGPLPLVSYADEAAINTAKKAKLNSDCLSVVGGDLYASDNSSFVPYQTKLNYVAPVDPSTVSLSDLKTLHNALLADMQLKGWML